MGVESIYDIPEDFSLTEGSCARPYSYSYAFPLPSPICHNLHHITMDENQTSAPTSNLNPTKWIAQLVAAVILAEGNLGMACFSHQQFTDAAAGQGDGSRPSVSDVPRQR